MLSRALARGLAADTKTLASSQTTPSPFRLARALSSYILSPSQSVATRTSSPFATTLCVRSYATAQPAKRKAAGTQRKPATPRKKATKAKKKKKPAKKAAPKKKKPAARKKKQPTDLELKRAKVRELRSVALLQTPKQLPQTAYLIYSTEQSQKGTNATEHAKDISAQFKNLPASEVEHYQNIALQNRRANERTIKNWIESHTPDEIRLANNARRQLNRIAKEPKPTGAGRALVSRSVNLLSDSRVPVKYDTPFIAFTRDRWASGDFASVPVSEAGKAIGREWRNLSSSDAQKYHDSFAANKARYDQEYDRLFTRSSPRKS